ncbi:penicillin-binding protein 1B [Thioalkalivibrio denitrificans]|uniref:Penicillin-binding protein 1B n=1 Tax=Thioalkalivibrio denitrificans TaxID=108003 RepID=A0A1V3NMC6_9GAMM|nr:penicillin-binding protein 1B [Thioalkalivibrio denitrificans]OOG25916.1 penicillin-binding protein 1B [Thioalkalivibrio denitrificans]
MARRKPARKTPVRRKSAARRRRKVRQPRRIWRGALLGLLLGILGLGGYTVYLDYEIRSQFEGKRWAVPARVFARPLELYPGRALEPAQLTRELELIHYRRGDAIRGGEFREQGGRFLISTRGFPFADGAEPPRRLSVELRDGRVRAITELETGQSASLARLEPALIANIYPRHGEDRVLVRLDEVPELLVEALIAVEDRKFYEHRGLDFSAIARAALANLRAGRTVQGGSTITQQLVKNYFLTHDRTLRRKVNEAIMAVLLEWRYEKSEILEAYLNEVYLGQDGDRAIHGFGLASQFYFQRRLDELHPEQLALLVAMVRGPSYYDPRRRAERATARRNLVLEILEGQGALNPQAAARARTRPLGVSVRPPSGVTPFPAFLDLVRAQLRRDYREQDLQSEGLLIFSTLDPGIQLASEGAVADRLNRIEGTRGLEVGTLQAGVVVSAVDSGEVLAVVGDRNPRHAGFNRAINARRPVGSLLKPAVYLAALSRPSEYTLATLLDDGPLTVRLDNGDEWTPRNYDREHHGLVPALEALVHSYNVATARLGLSLGLAPVIEQLQRLGVKRSLQPYPSLLLGAVEFSPFEMTHMYQSLAAGGFETPPRAIREVMDAEGRLLNRYPMDLRQAADPAAVYLVTAALHEVTRRGTGAALNGLLPADLPVAGKTGTTDDNRDAWFAGYAGDVLSVVWVGRDDNIPMGLSGASGALPVWADLMRGISRRGLDPIRPEGMEWLLIDPANGLRAVEGCEGALWMPFMAGSAPAGISPCADDVPSAVRGPLRWFRELFE